VKTEKEEEAGKSGVTRAEPYLRRAWKRDWRGGLGVQPPAVSVGAGTQKLATYSLLLHICLCRFFSSTEQISYSF
jgi:hypothetical protein